MKETLILFILMLTIAIREGYVLKWALDNRPKDLSGLWHGLGAVMRALPLALAVMYIWGDWWLIGLITLFWANWAWTVYDLAINIINDWPWFYTGKTSQTETVFKARLIWIGKGLLFIGTVIYTLIYFL